VSSPYTIILWWFILFASELKALHEHPSFDKSLNLSGLSFYLQKGYFHPNDCIFKYVTKLEPGSYLELEIGPKISINKYWDIDNIFKNSIIDSRCETDITEDLENKLLKSFKYRMVSDVEVGVF